MKKILLIEDDLPTIDLYQGILKKAGFSFEILQWGKDGLEFLDKVRAGQKDKPDLMLLDLILPDINGIDIAKRAKEDEATKDIPIFVLTNYTDPKLEKEILSLGIDKYLVKASYTPSQLMKIIKEWFKGR